MWTVKPSADTNIKDHIIRLHGADKTNSESASPPTELYVPSKYEIMQVAKRIEDITGMKVSTSFKKGEISIKFISRDEATKMTQEEFYSTSKKFMSDKTLLEELRREIMEGVDFDMPSIFRATSGFFSSEQNTAYIVRDNIEELFRLQCAVQLVSPNSEEGKRIERFLVLNTFVHEQLHQTIKENIPEVANWSVDSIREQVKIHSELAGDEEAMEARWQIVRDGIDARQAFDEGIAYYAGYRVISKFGYSYKAMRQSTLLKEDEEQPLNSKGMAFLGYIEKKTGENPIKYTIKHPPLTMRHIDHPDEYLRDLKEGRV